MKKIIHYLLSGCTGILLSCCSGNQTNHSVSDSLANGFVNIPDSVQTAVYWYWLSDHISEAGVIKDLHAMKEAGINRAFIGNIGLNEEESGTGKVKFYSEEWWKILHTALKTATESGIDIGIFNSPGWSQSGGPWIQPEQAMRYLASTSTMVKGGQKVEITLPRPESPFKESFQDVKTVAYPALRCEVRKLSLENTTVKSNTLIRDIHNLLDGKQNTSVTIDTSYLEDNEVTIDFEANTTFTLRGLKIYVSELPVNCPAKIQVKVNDGCQTLSEFTISRFNPQLNVGFDPCAPVVISVPATNAIDFRLIISNINQSFGIREIEFSSIPFVERYPEKTMAKMFQTPLPLWNEYQWPVQPVIDDPSLVVDPSQVIDISANLTGDRLTWEAPEGDWVVMRTGMLPTGVTNAPARPEATGLEADKMSKKHIEHHFNAYLGEIYKRIPAEDRKCWKTVVEDSYETGGQNFTDNFLQIFSERYGYDPLPFLPVYSGVVVGSEDISDRFLWDMRRLVADRVAYDYVGGLREVSHKHGLTTWLENYGHWGFPGEFLQYGGQSDEIGGEFWSEGTLGDIENRAASSCGHIYGKNKIWAESFTAGGGGYHRYPAMMKQRGDRFFSEGINSTLLHLYIAQPCEDREPGVNAWFGNEFNRTNTWFPHMDLFITYLKRVNYMLQQGLNKADVAYFIGEDAPKMTGIRDPELPIGYQFDYINAEVIERDLFVRDGLLTLPHGTQYKILVLPKLKTMRPELLTKIQQLIEAGAVVLGSAPQRSPSYENYPQADRQVRESANALWSQIDPQTKCARIGNGLLIDGTDLAQALEWIDCVPDCKLKQDDPVLFAHRSINGIEIYFVANQRDQPVTVTPEFRVKDRQPEYWNPVTGKIHALPSFEQTETGTLLPLKLDTYESAFIVFRNKPSARPKAIDVNLNFPVSEKVMELSSWTVFFDKEKRGPETPVRMNPLTDLTASDCFDIQHYSGAIRYHTQFALSSKPAGKLYLNLHEVSAMAKVKVNEAYAGGIWTPPYKVDISDFVKPGQNTIEVEVTTTWVNRLIGDLKLPESERKTWLTTQPWKADSPLQKTGLIGPVWIEKTGE
ncbi:MAG: glycoside hydrolase family 2 [Tannerella sp.]|jgi:hypothetical protein|nr:glycoside hydrolase family 2 [Tannerella sp.]